MKLRWSVVALATALNLVWLTGCSQAPPEPQVPAITFDSAGQPSLAPTGDLTPPATLQVKVLTPGDGPALEEGQQVEVLYAGWLWASGALYNDVYRQNAPASFPLNSATVMPGWVEGLVGQKVGSVVEVVIPPDKGYGSQAAGGVPANSTLVFVFTIIGAS